MQSPLFTTVAGINIVSTALVLFSSNALFTNTPASINALVDRARCRYFMRFIVVLLLGRSLL
jgi:hypothetical protein